MRYSIRHKQNGRIRQAWLLKIFALLILGQGFTAPGMSQDSPDGRRLAFCSQEEGGNSEIYMSTSEGKGIRRVTFNKATDTAPTWSPTSRQIAFTSDRGGTPQIYIMDAEGSNVTRVSFGGTYHDAPAWAPTGDRIAYVSRVDQIFDLYVLNLRTKQIIKLKRRVCTIGGGMTGAFQ